MFDGVASDHLARRWQADAPVPDSVLIDLVLQCRRPQIEMTFRASIDVSPWYIDFSKTPRTTEMCCALAYAGLKRQSSSELRVSELFSTHFPSMLSLLSKCV